MAGDLIGTSDNVIDQQALYDLTMANKGRRGFTYTHYPMNHSGNQSIVRKANAEGFTVNVSTNTVAEALATQEATGLPVVTIVAPEFWQGAHRREGVVQCPAEYKDKVTCATCKLCSVATRKDIVGFTVHGTKAKAANVIATG